MSHTMGEQHRHMHAQQRVLRQRNALHVRLHAHTRPLPCATVCGNRPGTLASCDDSDPNQALARSLYEECRLIGPQVPPPAVSGKLILRPDPGF